PVRVGASNGDIVAGMFLTQGVLAALLARHQTGLGQKIDVAMLDSQLAILEHAVAITAVTGVPPGPNGARHPTIAPFETYHAQDGQFVLAAGNDALFAKACAALGLGPLERDPRFATNAARCENVRTLKGLVETVTLDRPRAHWIAVLEAAGVPTGAIQNVAEVMRDPQILARNMVVTIAEGPGGRPLPCAGNPVKMSDLPDPMVLPPAPGLDGDRQAILDWLGDPAR
ncbi:MAG TPA: CoA transferase, partial [Paracoccus sp. (in: a-proteobacteria)]|nr:CoA transferase [Paracoccus sp. (in: a-proteobacteria)]